jgi:hypothetical protein
LRLLASNTFVVFVWAGPVHLALHTGAGGHQWLIFIFLPAGMAKGTPQPAPPAAAKEVAAVAVPPLEMETLL